MPSACGADWTDWTTFEMKMHREMGLALSGVKSKNGFLLLAIAALVGSA